MHSIETSILVNAPVEMCYKHWMDFESFPRFMRRVLSVRPAQPEAQLSDDRSGLAHTDNPQKDYDGVMTTEVVKEVAVHGNQVWHWEVKGPMGQVFEWNAGIVMNMPNKAVSWASTADQDLPCTGTINFLKAPPPKQHHKGDHEMTLISVTMSFSAPGGPLGEFLADVSHYGDNVLSEALGEFKVHVESLYSEEVGQSIQPEAGEGPMTHESQVREELGASKPQRPT